MSFNLTGLIDGSVGTAQGRAGTTIETFIISLASGFILFAVQFIAFLCVRIYPWAKRIYQPRSFLVPLKNRLKPAPNNPFKWLVTVFKIPASAVLEKSGMDGYFFLRYLSMCLKIFFPMAIVILPILLPINASNGKGSNTIDHIKYNITGLDTLAWSNVSPDHTSRYWAHLILALAVVSWVCLLFRHELLHYIRMRQEYLSHPGHRLKASATSVLITDIPGHLCTVEKLTEHYDDFPGGLRRIWINRDFRPLSDMVAQRNKFENQLENAETNLIRTCLKESRKMKNESDKKARKPKDEEGEATQKPSRKHVLDQTDSRFLLQICESDLQYDLDSQAVWTKYVSPKQRSKTRIPKANHTFLFEVPLIGRLFAAKVDTIYYCRRKLAELNIAIEKETETAEAYPGIHSAFLQFNTQKAAHLACQGLSHPLPNVMTRRTLELAPGDINWPNLGLPWWQRYLRLGGFILLFVVLIFLFGIISVFTGILSKASTLGSSTSWLRWIDSLPNWLLSFIQGTLPPVILIVVLSGPLPIFLRMFTNDIQGATTGTEGERSLQLWYFIFLLFELFIVPTISSGLTSVVRELVQDPGSIPNILATNLPTAANYYFSFLIVEALSISASSILQTIRLLNYYVLGSTNTPDSVFNSLTWTNRTRIGSNIPWYCTYAVIGLVYSVIAPLMLVFMLITFSLFWFVIKNNLLYVVRTGNVDGGALFFPDAINQTFTGLYFMEACLIGLFFLVRDAQDRVACEAQGIIMSVALVLTIAYQLWLYSTLHPLYTYLPVTMEGDAKQRDKEYEMERLRAHEKDEEVTDGKSGELVHRSTNEHGAPSMDASRPILHDVSPEGLAQGLQSSSEKAPGGMSNGDEKGGLESTTEHDKNSQSTERTADAHEMHSTSPRASYMQAQQQRDGQSAKRILARLNKPLDEARLSELEERLVHVEHSIGNVLAPHQADVERQMMNDPISKIIMQHNDELEDLENDERDLLISVAFTHPVLREARPCVWLPQDSIGVSDDEVRRTRDFSADVIIDNKGAFFHRNLKVGVDKQPPDMSEFALLMAEL